MAGYRDPMRVAGVRAPRGPIIWPGEADRRETEGLRLRLNAQHVSGG